MNYVQCKMRRGSSFQTAYIPEKFATKGHFVRIKESDGWEVVEIGIKRSEDVVKDRSHDHTRTRKASDI